MIGAPRADGRAGDDAPGADRAVDWVQTYPARAARTRRFTLGQPRSVLVSADGARVVFLRSSGAENPATDLWVLDTPAGDGSAGHERLLADAGSLPLGAAETDLEAARRERLRESASGITSYACDAAAEYAVFAVGGRLFRARLTLPIGPRSGTSPAGGPARDAGAAVVAVPTLGDAFDPRPDPSGRRRIAYVSGGSLRLVATAPDGTWTDRELAAGAEDVTWGLPEFVAQEEMQRHRGYWWAPDGSAILVARADTASVQSWYLADAASPERAPRTVRYPAAGGTNATVSLFLIGLDADGPAEPVPVTGWDADTHPYLVSASWTTSGPPLVAVQSRDQRSVRVLAIDPGTGAADVVTETIDDRWVEIVPGVPRWAAGELLLVADRGGARRLLRGGRDLTGPGTHVRAVLDVGADDALVLAQRGAGGGLDVLTVGWDGSVEELSEGPGVHGAARGGGTTVVWSALPMQEHLVTEVRPAAGPHVLVANHAATSGAALRATRLPVVAGIRSVLVLPGWYRDGPLPVLMCPYGGPHARMVLDSAGALRHPQWYAERGYAVVVADGRGTPGSPSWEKAIYRDLAGPVLDDQVTALDAAADVAASRGLADLDLARVGIRGWSFGGYLAALAVLRRPDRFHAAVAGAPVTDWTLYDTHYTERYLGMPDGDAAAYARSGLLVDAARPVTSDRPARPLMLIHGTVDDNVVVAHTLRLSAALLAGGRPHTVLPLSGVTHFTPQVTVAENLARLEAEFLDAALAPGSPSARPTPADDDPTTPRARPPDRTP